MKLPENWGLRLSGIVVSCCVAGGIALGTVQANDIWHPPAQAWGWLVVILLAFSQFGANSCLAERSKGQYKEMMLAGFVLFSIMTGIGVHRAWEEYRAVDWEAGLAVVNGNGTEANPGTAAARDAERAPLLAQRTEAQAIINRAGAAQVALGAAAQSTFRSRTEVGAGALSQAVSDARDTIVALDAQLAQLPVIERLPTKRPADWIDLLALIAALAIVGLEYVIWSSVHTERGETSKVAQDAPPVRVRDADSAPRRGRRVAGGGGDDAEVWQIVDGITGD